jgi:hypothetical protein
MNAGQVAVRPTRRQTSKRRSMPAVDEILGRQHRSTFRRFTARVWLAQHGLCVGEVDRYRVIDEGYGRRI